jgi:hypothetical protein
VIAYTYERYEFSGTGVTTGGLGGRTKFLRWIDIEAVRYAPRLECFHLIATIGPRRRISVNLPGIEGFAKAVLQ